MAITSCARIFTLDAASASAVFLWESRAVKINIGEKRRRPGRVRVDNKASLKRR